MIIGKYTREYCDHSKLFAKGSMISVVFDDVIEFMFENELVKCSSL